MFEKGFSSLYLLLFNAIHTSKIETVLLLLDKGIDINDMRSYSGSGIGKNLLLLEALCK
jgi:hypothetical protein